MIRAVRRSSRNEAEKNSHSTEFSSYNTEDGTSKFEIRIANSQVGNEKVFERYCNLSKLSVEEKKFCYDTESIRKDIFRMMELGATEERICKKVNKVNPDFCKTLAASNDAENAIVKSEKQRERGVIYE